MEMEASGNGGDEKLQLAEKIENKGFWKKL